MKKIQLSDENKSVLHILTREEWSKIDSDYKSASIYDKKIKCAFFAWIWNDIIF